jgi:flavin-dependent dehydrogenase
MSQRRGSGFDVLIGGAGIAAAAVAVRLCALGFHPLILATRSRILPGIEAIPEAALPLFEELGIRHILRQANGLVVEGFENHWRAGEPMLRRGRWIHVERALLAKAAIRHAVEQGAVLRLCESLPKLAGSDPVCITHGGSCLSFGAAIDATGRSAVWSRPVQRCGRQLADIFAFSQQSSPRGRVVRLSQGWAYQLGLKHSTTVAMLGEYGANRHAPDAPAREALGLISRQIKYVGRRPAFPQWSENSIRSKRIAVGDAALAYDPLAGQGIRFALSSAIAAATVVNSWRHSPGEAAAAERFYLDYLNQSRFRHLKSLDQIRLQEQPAQPAINPLPEVVIFSGQTIRTDLHVNSRIVSGLAILLPEGTPARWVGGVDLLRLRELAREPVRSSDLMQRLVSADLTPIRAAALLGWCVRHELISAVAVDWPLAGTADNALTPPGVPRSELVP